MKSKKQDEVIRYLAKHGESKMDDIYLGCKIIFYHWNPMKHLSTFLSRMVKNGTIERAGKGVFKLTDTPQNRSLIDYYKEQEVLK